MTDLIELGRLIKEGRRKKNQSQSSFAAAAGLSRARLEALENGRLADMSYRNVLRLLHAAGLDLRVGEFNWQRPTLEDLRREEPDA